MTSRKKFLALCGLLTFGKHCRCSSLLPLLLTLKRRSRLSKVSTRSPHSPISLSQLTTHQDSPISTSERLCFPLHQLLLLVCSVIVPPFYSNVLGPNHFIKRYAPAFENSDYDFAPVVFETSG